MDEKIKEYSIGVIVARFQVHELHEGHHHIIKQVTDKHKKTIIFLGVPKFVGTKRNPLDFDTRKRMIQSDYPNTVILAIPDQSDNIRWANEIDRRIREVYQHGEVLMYGSRDSFIPHYIDGLGKFKTKELKPLGTFTGTDVRKILSEEVRNSQDFRSGVIYHAYNLYPRVIPAVDVAIIDDNKVLLAKKYDESKFRFIGGFVKVEDENLESAVKRVIHKEAGINISCGEIKMIFSTKVNDWRFRGENDKIMTNFFTSKYLWGAIQASDDIMELKWFEIDKIKETDIMPDHHDILNKFKSYDKNNNFGD
jgi:bifunctional NMN adenylyltransferase/nudix hydrolase